MEMSSSLKGPEGANKVKHLLTFTLFLLSEFQTRLRCYIPTSVFPGEMKRSVTYIKIKKEHLTDRNQLRKLFLKTFSAKQRLVESFMSFLL